MFQQLVAAELNIDCLDSNQSCVSDAIQAADLLWRPILSAVVSELTVVDWQAITSSYNTLVNYNKEPLRTAYSVTNPKQP